MCGSVHRNKPVNNPLTRTNKERTASLQKGGDDAGQPRLGSSDRQLAQLIADCGKQHDEEHIAADNKEQIPLAGKCIQIQIASQQAADDLIQHVDGEHIGRRAVDDPALQRELTEEQQQQNSGKNNKDRTIPRKSAVDDTLMQGQRSVGAKDERRGSCNSEEQPLFGTMPGVIARQIASQQIDHHKMCKSLAGILHHIVGCERWNQAEDEQQ